MRHSRVWSIPCMLLILLVIALAASSCALPLPSPRESHVTATQEAATVELAAAITDTSTPVPTNTPVILVLPTHTVRPSPTSSRATAAVPSGASAELPTRTAPATESTTSKPAASATRVLAKPSATATSGLRVAPTTTKAAKAAPTATSEPSPTPTATMTAESRVTAASLPVELETGNVIRNGDFEGGFGERGIGKDWQGFDNATGEFGWSDETWPGILSDGEHAQMMRIKFTSKPDQYVGIQQTVPVVSGEAYELTLHGLIRSVEGSADASNWGYRVQWGIDPKGRDSWKVVEKWYDTGWDDQPLDAQDFTIDEHKATITPPEDTLTLFIRGWRKWGTQDREVNFVIDGVSLVGPTPPDEMPANLPATGAPGYTWTLTAIASFILVVMIIVLRKVRNRLATNR